jgi:hypothetical protein
VNGVSGRKLVPSPSVSRRTAPPCTPLSDPTTLTGVTGLPLNVIWVCDEATVPPGVGNVYTVAGAALEPAAQSISVIRDEPVSNAPRQTLATTDCPS